MPFCTNCGSEVEDNAKFCKNCGAAVNQPYKSANSERKTIYEGNIYKCPHCGEVLNSFVAVCPSCGYELRGKQATDSVKEFYSDLRKAQTTNAKDHLIRNYPIPNAKEDILEFMILASSNIVGEDDRDIYEAWIAKFEQAYQKAELLFSQDKEFVKIQQIYNNCIDNIETENQRKINKFAFDTVIRNIIACVGIVILIIAVVMDRTGGNASLMEIVGGIVLIASATSLIKRGATAIDYIVSAICGLVMFWLASMFNNGSFVQLCAGIELIIVAVNYFKSINKSKK